MLVPALDISERRYSIQCLCPSSLSSYTYTGDVTFFFKGRTDQRGGSSAIFAATITS